MDNQPLTARPPSAIVLGGGLAGMAAAVSLLKHGYAVTLVERRPYLGGRAFSFIDRETGVQVDNGQHVFLGCCAAFRQFIRELGVEERASLQRRLRVPVLSPTGQRGVLSEASLPAPFHLLPSFLRYPFLTRGEKVRAIPALLRIWRADYARSPKLEEQTFHQWLKGHRQSESSIARFWNLITLPTLNDDIRNVSARMGFMVFQQGLLRSRRAGRVGYPQVGLSALMGEPAQAYIQSHGGAILFGRSAQQLLVKEERIVSVALANGETVTGDYCISALPFDSMLEVLPPVLQDDSFFARPKKLQWAPIVDLHIWLDRPVMDEKFAAFVESPIQWLFNKSRIYGLNGGGQYLTISLSGAWDYWDRPKEELHEKFVQELRRAFPLAREARVERFIVVKEQRATFRSVPGATEGRLSATTPIANLFLAGDWTDTGWPATMEGAVRSGLRAAQLVMEASRR